MQAIASHTLFSNRVPPSPVRLKLLLLSASREEVGTVSIVALDPVSIGPSKSPAPPHSAGLTIFGYMNSLECVLNMLGVPGCSYEAFQSLTIAREKFHSAQQRGEVEAVAAA